MKVSFCLLYTSGTVPYGTPEEQFQQIDWFGMFGEREDKEKQPRCLVHNWTGGGSVEFLSLPVKGKKAMKFDFIIGNPPYQDETIGDNKGFAPPIYHKFLEGAYQIAEVSLFHAGTAAGVVSHHVVSEPRGKRPCSEKAAGSG